MQSLLLLLLNVYKVISKILPPFQSRDKVFWGGLFILFFNMESFRINGKFRVVNLRP